MKKTYTLTYTLVLVFVAASFGSVYEFTLTTQPELRYSHLELHQGTPNPTSGTMDPTHNLQIINVFNEAVYEQNYSIVDYLSTTCMLDECEDRVQFLEEPDLFIRVPYFVNAKEILIKEIHGEEQLRINVTHFSRYCGNNICNDGYNERTCPEDCLSESVRNQEQHNTQQALIWVLVATILSIIGLVYRRRTRT